VARDRKRARQRRRSKVADGAGSPNRLHRSNVPGELDHASGDVDEFEAALVRGAHGSAGAPADEPEEDREIDEGEADEGELEREALAAGGGAGVGQGLRPVARERAPEPARQGGNRVIAFLRASWAELQRVQWPDRRQVAQATAVVLGFVAIAGVYLGVADYVAKKIVDAIL
jgi:preprotein translocase subunit SecE